jgi:hypothetical protein
VSANGIFAGFRILPLTLPTGIMTPAAMTEVLQQVAWIFKLEFDAVAAVVGASTFTFNSSIAPSASLVLPGIVIAANEAAGNKIYANIGILDGLSNPVNSINARPIFARVTSVTGVGPYTYTATFYDDADQSTAVPTVANWPAGAGASIGIVETPWRKRISDTGQTDFRTRFIGLNATQRDAELLQDVFNLYAQTGTTAGGMPVYAFHTYIANGDSLTTALGKVDAELVALAALIASNNSGSSTQLNELYAKSGIVTGVANTYTSTFYVANADTLKAAIGKLDTQASAVTTRATALELYQATTGVRYTGIVPTGAIAAGNLVFTLPAAPKVVAGIPQIDLFMQTFRYTPGLHFNMGVGANANQINYVAGYEPQSGEGHTSNCWV